MLQILLFTVNSILPVILLAVIGYFLKCIGFFKADFLKAANRTVFYLCLPVLLFKNIADIEDISEIRFDVIIYALLVIAALYVTGLLLSLTVSDPKQKGVIHQCIFRSNFALIGVPLAELMAGAEGVRAAAVLSLFSIPTFNILAVLVLSIYKGGKVKIDVKKILLDVCKNPLIIGVLLGLVFSLVKQLTIKSGLANPLSELTFFSTTISYISRAATPLALLVLGGQFDLKRISGYKKQLIIGVFGRNIVAPVIGVGIACVLTLKGILNFTPAIFASLISLFGTPVAVASAIMADAMDNDGQLAGQLVVWTSFLSMGTLFIIIFTVKSLGLL